MGYGDINLDTPHMLHSLMMVLPNIFYKFPYWNLIINTIDPQTNHHLHTCSFHLKHPSFRKNIKFLSRFGMCSTPCIFLILPSLSFNLILPHPMILASESSPKYTSPQLYCSYSQNHSLWGVICHDAPESIIHISRSEWLPMESIYRSHPCFEEFFDSMERVSLDPFYLLTFVDMKSFL